MNIGALWLMIYASLKDKEDSLEIWDDKSITILLVAFLIVSIMLLLGVLYVAFWR